MAEPDKKQTILIVEDESSLRNALGDKLTREGYTVLMAKNGKEGLKIALAEHPDLIMLDIVMPVMDGITMLKKVNADPWGKHTKVVMLTNLSDHQNVAYALALGSHDFLVKSDWKIDDVVKLVVDKLKSVRS